LSPFIFQLPATSGRSAIVFPKSFAKKVCDNEPLADRLHAEKGRFTSKTRWLRRDVTLLIVRRL
jgi:hypothetical protein